MFIYHIDMVILDIDVGYGLMIWEMTVSIWEMTTSIWDILSLCLELILQRPDAQQRAAQLRVRRRTGAYTPPLFDST